MLAQRMKQFASTLVLAMTALTMQASAFVLPAHSQLRVYVDGGEPTLVSTALDILKSDFQRVLDASVELTADRPHIIIASLGGPSDEILQQTGIDLSWIQQEVQAFTIAISSGGQLIVAGSDAYGTAYGLMELSRLLGVSPLEWWADVDPQPLLSWELPDGFVSSQSPYVSFRGMHVNDIEWGFRPWMTRTFDPAAVYPIDKKTVRHIFELMLRQRLNTFWTSVDGVANSFFETDEGRAMADAYGIFLGSDVQNPIDVQGLDDPRMFCDDGFGYITRFPTEEDAQQPGGCGLYYHASFQGAPHDYLWLGTASPFLMFQQLSEAFYHGAHRLWVLNVGDIKPCEYQLTLFADMAWNLEAVRQLTIGRHLEEFFAQTIGRDVARLISIYMKEFYHLSFQRKPEHLAGTRLGEPAESLEDWNSIHDMPWSEKRIRHRLTRYDLMRRNVTWVGDSVRRTHPDHYDAFFELVEYPVMATINQNLKYMLAQLARHGRAWMSGETVQGTWRRSDQAHNRIQELTQKYNFLRGGKWQGIMSSNPASLQVFQPVPHTSVATPLPADPPTIASFYGASYHASSFSGGSVLDPVLGLGASIRAMPIPKDCNVTYKYKYNYGTANFTTVLVRLLPTHPIEGQQRFTLTLDGGEPQTFTYDAEIGSEVWKQNVLRNYAIVTARMQVTRPTGEHQLVIGALDDGVVVDEVFVYPATQQLLEQ